jgi:2-polyprenyl-3-methyl-5-hydroxy-6-metoxy-1,4-benzoquinol methylase
VWSDLGYEEYEATRHNVWDDEVVDRRTEDFYGRARERAHHEFLDRIAPGPGRLLDVGCGLGYFLARASHAGWDVRGCDTSPAWVNATNERVGRPVASLGEVDGVIERDERFDVITVWDVIEHVYEPVPFLRSLAAHMNAHGRIFIRTPNVAYVLPVYSLRRLLGHDVELGPTNHVVYFNASTMRRALALAGLKASCWPVLAPPQVETFAEATTAPGRIVRLKNGYASVADRLAKASRGRLVLGSDLDVVARAVPR